MELDFVAINSWKLLWQVTRRTDVSSNLQEIESESSNKIPSIRNVGGYRGVPFRMWVRFRFRRGNDQPRCSGDLVAAQRADCHRRPDCNIRGERERHGAAHLSVVYEFSRRRHELEHVYDHADSGFG